MMTLFEKVKADFLQARKNREATKVSLLSTFIGDLETMGKNNGNRAPTDEEVIALAKKYFNNIKEVIAVSASQTLVEELEAISVYIPVQYTEEELKTIAAAMYLTHGANIGAIMKDMKRLHAGYYDGQVFMKVLKTYTK